ncbi:MULTISPECIES: type II secretion system protein GspM [unclassified Iodobacter]|uniref:type II secretion system protein GspM n=1 Tax=unclassified Iodobacter TaxID=235634 RepID=UPI0025D136BD|nr:MULTISPECIES: type II secretion system protein GspM [unclassified Iodobacter]MDW5417615.1 type II secretion system protein GspM [Iodobacter sp. CM08]
MNKFKEFWQQRNPRERIYLSACAGFAAFAILYAGIWQPISTSRALLSRQVPQMQLQLAELQRQLSAIKATPAGPSRSGDLRASVQASLDAKNTSADIQALSADKLQIKIAQIRFADALPLLAALRNETGSRIHALNISGTTHNGLVQLTATVERQ